MTNPILFPTHALDQSIFHRFQEMVSKFPDKCAVKSADESVTYAELLKKSQAIAHRILTETISKKPIALLLPQGPQFISGMFGCLTAGTPYVPLDKNYPVERLQLMVEVAQPTMVFTNREMEFLARAICGDLAKIILIEDLQSPPVPITGQATPDSHAYLLFTSGSTGRPKAVLECHRNILHNVLRQTNSFFITSDDKQTLLYTCGVYGGARDIFCALLNGATLCHYDIEKIGYAHIGSWIKENQITIYCSVATIFRYLSQYMKHQDEFKSVRIIKLGGEASRKSDIETFKQIFADHCVFYTGLASTETGTISQYPIYKNTVISGEMIPLGSPAIGMKVHVLGEDGIPVPTGEVGQIVVESEFLSLGYYNQPEQSAQKFFELNGSRFYKIGDLGRYDANQCLWHSGRGDAQIKIRGNRIELNEVETAFLTNPELADSLVTTYKNSEEEVLLVAYVEPKEGIDVDIVALRKYVSTWLPSFMIPTSIVPMKKLPRTVNGKINRTALPDPLKFSANKKSDEHVGMDVWQSMVASAWKRVLKIDNLVPEDNFFAIGGHSLGLVQVIDEVERRMGAKIAIAEFIKNPTFGNMTQLARNAKDSNSDPMLTYRLKENQDCVLLIPGILGLGLTYRLLNEELNGPWSIIAPQLSEEGEHLLADIDALAERIVQNTLKLAGKNRIHIFGYSFGGFIGVKVLELLLEKNHEIGVVGLFDSDAPFSPAGTFPLVDPVMAPQPADKGTDTILAKSLRAMKILKEVRASWTPKLRYRGHVHMIQSSLENKDRQQAQAEQWKIIYPSIQISQVDASHVNFFNYPHVTKVARIIEEVLSKYSNDQQITADKKVI